MPQEAPAPSARRLQVVFWTGPKCIQNLLRWPHGGPRRPQTASEPPQNGPNKAPARPQSPPR
eukprot:7868690-Pyramimonas_sp.AAC.1